MLHAVGDCRFASATVRACEDGAASALRGLDEHLWLAKIPSRGKFRGHRPSDLVDFHCDSVHQAHGSTVALLLPVALRTRLGESRLEAADPGAATAGEAAPVQPPAPAFLVLADARVGRMESCPGHNSARDGYRLATARLPLVLATKKSVETSWAPTHLRRGAATDPNDEPGQPALGRSSDSR